MKLPFTLLLILVFGYQSFVLAQKHSHQETSELTIIDRMAISESYNITIYSIGCFNDTAKIITVVRNNSNYVAILNNTETILNASKINALRNFENQLQHINSAGCSTVDTYTINFGPEKKVYRDDTCSNFFGKELLQQLELEFN